MRNRGEKGAVLILARYPRPGMVKSRLAQRLGDVPASEFYRLCAERLFAELDRLPPTVCRYLFFDDRRRDDADEIRRWVGRDLRFHRQPNAEFGERMVAGFRQAFLDGATKAIIVGTDIPDLNAELLTRALHLLDRYPLVIGPDRGGGFYLLGMRMLHRELFQLPTPWGSDEVYLHTLKQMERYAYVPAVLPTLFDIDTGEDLRGWVEEAFAKEPMADSSMLRFAQKALRDRAST
jgi:rSAM/selenodomain-associated transferase 1